MSRVINGHWSELDVRKLVSFKVVAETCSFADTARKLGYTQSAVSQQIARLESIVGYRLVSRRSGRGQVRLTPAGARFLQHVTVMIDTLACARADLDAIAAGAKGPVRVGAFQSVAAGLVPELIDRLAQSGSSFDVQLIESEPEEAVLAMLDRGELDFAFTVSPTDQTHYASVELLDDDFFLVGAGEQSSKSKIKELKDLAGVPIIAPRTCRTWARIASQLDAAGIAPNYAFRTDDNVMMKGLVCRGLGVAFVSRLTLEMIGDGLVATPIDHLVPARVVALTWSQRRALTAPHLRFIDVTREVARALKPERGFRRV